MAASESDQYSNEDMSQVPPATDSGSAAAAEDESSAGQPLHQHHVAKLLDEALEAPDPTTLPRKFKPPLFLDFVFAAGLLIATGGFTVGMFKMYLTHMAQQAITRHELKSAIAILKGEPLPGFFELSGDDPATSRAELLNQALYLDAMDKLDVDNDTEGALKELSEIQPGSRYFSLAQEVISENFVPSSTTLQGGASHTEINPVVPEEKKPILPELPQDGSK